jgi:hypothetical protein
VVRRKPRRRPVIYVLNGKVAGSGFAYNRLETAVVRIFSRIVGIRVDG